MKILRNGKSVEQVEPIYDERTERAIRELREALMFALCAMDNVKTICDEQKARIAVVDAVLAKLSAKGE